MRFQYKCYLQTLLSSVQRGEKLNCLFQKYITKRLPVSDRRFLKGVVAAKEHFDKFTKYTQSPDGQNITYYEFGAGWDLINPIALSLLGIQRLYCIDMRELVLPELLNNTISRLGKLKEEIGFDYSLSERIPLITASNFRDVLMKYFRIDYRAPMDARCTSLDESTVDFIVSNSTLEHIPEDDVVKILNECYRLLKKGGIVSCLINYKDHWISCDRSISIYNFLRYSPSQWQRYNPPLQYQNRLRHRDYLDIISQTQFEVLEDNPLMPCREEIDLLKNLQIDACFRDKYTFEELGIKSSKIVLIK